MAERKGPESAVMMIGHLFAVVMSTGQVVVSNLLGTQFFAYSEFSFPPG